MASDPGAATRVVRSAVVDPSGGGDWGGRLFSSDLEGRCSGSAREGVGRPSGAIPPADMAGIAGGGRAEARAGGRRKEVEKSAG